MLRRTVIGPLASALLLTPTGGVVAQTSPAGDAALWRNLGITRLPGQVEAPPFALKGLAGDMTDLKALRGQVVLAYFWTTW